MCGIAGYIGTSPLDEHFEAAALDAMQQRGPDHRAIFRYRDDDFFVSLLHARLSIIDLDPRSNQPFTLAGRTLVFNGEIYNYLELAQNLKNKGVVLNTSSDTEVLLHYYLLYGESCVDHFEGMWAFAIYDEATRKTFISRDPFGEKPLYYWKGPEGFFFASETRILKKLMGRRLQLNEQQLLRYLVNGHKSIYKSGETFYVDVHEVPPSTNLVLDAAGSYSTRKYWRPSFTPSDMSEAYAVEGVRHQLIESVRLRMRSDVPLAFCLSGGVDSASLVSIAAKELGCAVSTFSIIDSDSRYNEYGNILATIKDTGCTNTQIMLSPKEDHLSRLKNLIKYHDAPLGTISYYVHSLLSESIHASGYKIAISGTGADELFTGYYDHFNLHLYEMRNDPSYDSLARDWRQHVAQFVRHPAFQQADLYFNEPGKRDHIYLNNTEFASYLKKPFFEPFTEVEYSNSLLRNRMMNELFHEVVPVILHEDDLNSMFFSIENRSPFLDRRLFQFLSTVPNNLLIKEGYAKRLLRQAMQGILNDEVRLSREKKGFNASINSILDFANPNHRAQILDDGPVFDLIDKSRIEKLMGEGEFTNSFKKFLFNFINARIFLDQLQED